MRGCRTRLHRALGGWQAPVDRRGRRRRGGSPGKPSLAAGLWEAVSFPDALVGMRAIDALEKASAQRPEVLEGHAAETLEDLAASKFAEVRWHVGLLMPRLRLDPQQLGAAAEVLARLCDDQSRIVQANALEGLVRLAEEHTELIEVAEAATTRAAQSPHPSARARARRFLR